ncbi:Lysosomal acid lipase/cholesteryl ester hydrolase [Phytophthora citrophthora]|uniref:Lipase n=1 Tax=Phytophthora citrophthora TaxID=4793 RepID=A0AAD9LC67_9STRA|nr:Lysosomal acid lipase/cholesteryl ester hydrolase [Phytophthora citrophthora]
MTARLQTRALLLFIAIGLVSAINEVASVAEIAVDPDVGKNTPEIIAARGYDVETHKVTTSDGYILTLHRLPKSYDETQAGFTAAANKPAVLLQHGVVESSFAWVCNYRNQSLAFVLADAGYDVWLGNSRGNRYSNESINYTTDDDEFWNFSWEDMGLYDLPAVINYIQDTSGRSTISYVGHSQGVTQALVGFSANQTLAKSVSYFGALAPVSWLGNSKAELFVALADAHLDLLYQGLGIVELLPHSDLLTKFLAGYTCTAIDGICGSAISLLFGTTTSLNISHVPVLISQTPAGTSVKDVAHFAQGIREDTFARYDYGCSCVQALGLSLCSSAICKNKAKYGSFEPPAFSLGDMAYPRTGLYVGAGDTLTE